jgi:hypothetical protein
MFKILPKNLIPCGIWLYSIFLLIVGLCIDVVSVIRSVQVCLYAVDYTRCRAERYRMDV